MLLFVAGLSSKTTPQEVLAFFENLGRVRLLRLRSSKTGSRLTQANPQNNIRRGFCVLEALDSQSFAFILAGSGCVHKGRELTISKLRDEEEFEKFSSQQSRKCAILSEVPKFISSNWLLDGIERIYGQIRKVTNLKKRKQNPFEVVSSSRSFLVEFCEEASAQRAIKQGHHDLFGNDKYHFYRIMILKYERKIKISLDIIQTDVVSSTMDGPFNFESAFMKKEARAVMNCNEFQDWHSNNRNLADSQSLSMHMPKPTSAHYHAPRLYLDGCLTGGLPHDTQELRFNVLLRDSTR